mmetsp:Transcript_27748/g.63920  ORF Transcript_27748/g.63920 Transcript_27748/m.63920 type:complete len:218 (-) Transcript_27748:902-1555(-)
MHCLAKFLAGGRALRVRLVPVVDEVRQRRSVNLRVNLTGDFCCLVCLVRLVLITRGRASEWRVGENCGTVADHQLRCHQDVREVKSKFHARSDINRARGAEQHCGKRAHNLTSRRVGPLWLIRDRLAQEKTQATRGDPVVEGDAGYGSFKGLHWVVCAEARHEAGVSKVREQRFRPRCDELAQQVGADNVGGVVLDRLEAGEAVCLRVCVQGFCEDA